MTTPEEREYFIEALSIKIDKLSKEIYADFKSQNSDSSKNAKNNAKAYSKREARRKIRATMLANIKMYVHKIEILAAYFDDSDFIDLVKFIHEDSPKRTVISESRYYPIYLNTPIEFLAIYCEELYRILFDLEFIRDAPERDRKERLKEEARIAALIQNGYKKCKICDRYAINGIILICGSFMCKRCNEGVDYLSEGEDS